MREPWKWGVEHGPAISRPPLFPFAFVVNSEVRAVNAMCMLHAQHWARLVARTSPSGGFTFGLFLVARRDVVALSEERGLRCYWCLPAWPRSLRRTGSLILASSP